MEGTLQITGTDSELVKNAELIRSVMTKLEAFTDEERSYLSIGDNKIRLKGQLEECERAIELSKEFRRIKLDTSVTREVHTRRANTFGEGHPIKITVPLVFTAKLPAPRRVSKRGIGTQFMAVARVPEPPKDALDALNTHGSKFDHMEVWWIPSDILVQPIPKPDPIIVGVIKVGTEPIHFEIYRWTDERVESKYWAREGY